MSERPSLMARLQDMDNAELVRSWQASENTASRAAFERDMHRGEVLRRIEHSGMTGIDTEYGAAIKKPQFGPYEWDEAELERLVLSRLTASELAKCITRVPATVKVNTVAVKAAAQRLGLSEGDLARCYSRPEQPPKLEFREPDTLLDDLEASVAAVQS